MRKKKKKSHFHLKKAVFLIIISAISLSISALFVKLASISTTVNIIIFSRFAISFLYIVIVLGLRKLFKQKASIKTEHLMLHILRGVIGLLGMGSFYLALKCIPLVDGNLLMMTNALFIPVIGALFLHHKVNIKHWIAIIVGFLGVALILRPSGELFNPYSLIGLMGGLFIGIALLILRRLSKYDKHYVCMFYFFLISFLVSGIVSAIDWRTPNLHTFLLLLGIGVFGTLYQEFLNRASAYAPAKLTSALLYLSLIFSLFFDWIFFHDAPGDISAIGIILVVLSSFLTIYAARKKKKIL